jgi:hypothetical protein
MIRHSHTHTLPHLQVSISYSHTHILPYIQFFAPARIQSGCFCNEFSQLFLKPEH